MGINDYKDLGYQSTELAQLLGVGRSTLYLRDDWTLPDINLERLSRFIESSLLGDGSIVCAGDKSCYSHTSSNKEYLEFIRGSLIKLGLPCSEVRLFIWKKEKSGFTRDCNIYYLKSRKCKFLNNLRRKWYPLGKKEIPVDFEFNQQDIIRIYNEDGSKDAKSQCIFWGVKDEGSFNKFVDAIKRYYTVLSYNKEHKTGGRVIRLIGVEALPGYEYKAKW